MKHLRSLRPAFLRSLLGSTLLTASAFALTPNELSSLRGKAEKGNSIAQYNLGLAYADRAETFYDPSEAYVWLHLASLNGTNGKLLTALTSSLTPAQLAEGQRRLAARTPVSPVTASPIEPAVSPISAISETPVPTVSPDDQKKLSNELSAAWQESELLKAAHTTQLAEANKRVAIAEIALANKNREIAALQARLTTLAPTPTPTAVPVVDNSAELAALRQQRDQAQATVTASVSELASLRIAASKTAADSAALREKIAAAQRAQNLAESESSSLKAAADRASAERLAAAAQLETANSETAKLRTEFEAAQSAANSKTDGLSSTGATVLKAERDHLAESVQALEKERDALQAQLVAVKPAPPAETPAVTTVVTPPPVDEAAAARLADLEKAKADTDAKLAAALRTYTLQQGEIERLQKALASIDDERAANLSRLETAHTEVQSLRLQAEAAGSATLQANTLRNQLADTTRVSTEQAAALQRTEQDLAAARKSADSATSELTSLRDQLRQTQAQSAMVANENGQLKTRLALAGNAPSSSLFSPSRPGSTPPVSINFPSPAAPAIAPTPAPAKVETPAERTHIVGSGDSLSRISKQYYGTPNRWNDILQANRAVIRNPDDLKLGTKLRIP